MEDSVRSTLPQSQAGITHILAYWHSNEQHKSIKCYEKLVFFSKTEAGVTTVLLSTLQFQVCTWQLSIPIQWLWNTTSRDSKANNTQATGHRRLKLSLRVIFKGFIFSFLYASGLCCSLVIYQNGSLKSRDVIHTWITLEDLLEAFRKRDGMRKKTMHTNVLLLLKGKRLSNWHQ